MRRKTLDDLGSEHGCRLRVFFPGYGGGARVLETTGNSRPNESRAPCDCDWELKDPVTGKTEWVPGWYVASRTR